MPLLVSLNQVLLTRKRSKPLLKKLEDLYKIYTRHQRKWSEESDSEELRIKDVLEGLSQLVSRQNASNLLHNMAASKDILFWTPRGQLLRNQRIIPVTNISEVVEYVLLPYKDDAVKPRALKTFIDGLAVWYRIREFWQNYWKKNKPIAIRTVRLVIKKWSPKAMIVKTAQRQPLKLVNIRKFRRSIFKLRDFV